LREEGVEEERIFFVGNTMIDTLIENLDRLQKPKIYNEELLKEGRYFVMTLHRPANVDEQKKLKELINNIAEGVNSEKIVFPVHPRTKKILEDLGISYQNIFYTEPMGYLEFIYLVKHARAVITDSGGITEETTVLNIPCLTLRNNTERPETVTEGTNELVGTEPESVKPVLNRLMAGDWKKGSIPQKWDGNTSVRIIEVILKLQEEGKIDRHKPYLDNTLMFSA